MKRILWFCDKMLDKKPEDTTNILAWKVSPPIMANNEGIILIHISIENNLIKKENNLTMNFVRIHIFSKTAFGDVLSLPGNYEKK